MTTIKDDLADRLQNTYTGAVHDVLRAMGHGNCVLPPNIRLVDPAKKLAGRGFTMSGHIDQTLDPHESLLRWTGLLSKAEPGTVVICQPNTAAIALMGELSAETLKLRGVRGYIVDGGCRDLQAIADLGFPVFARYATPIDIVCAWRPEAYGEPVAIGGTPVQPDEF